MAGCHSDCFAYSTEVWFNVYMTTENYQSADTMQTLAYAACSNGCLFAGDPR